ncbi:MAG: hypothetical protein AAF531_10030 [Actinomycetota bacterium]
MPSDPTVGDRAADLPFIDFLVIGAPKAGTTWAWQYLDNNPGFFVPGAKDTYYFDRHYGRGSRWYRSHFADARPGQLVGEVCHDYMYDTRAIDRIVHDVPDTSPIIVILREPVSRALSQARYGYLMAHISALTPDAVVAEDPECIRRSRYEQFVPTLIDRFGDRLCILLYEDLVADPLGFAKQLAEACSAGLVGHGTTTLPGVVNPAARPRSVAVMRMLRVVVDQLDRVGQRRLIGAVKASPLRRLLFGIGPRGHDNPSPDLGALRARLASELGDSLAAATDVVARHRPTVRNTWTEGSGP